MSFTFNEILKKNIFLYFTKRIYFKINFIEYSRRSNNKYTNDIDIKIDNIKINNFYKKVFLKF